MQCVSLSTGWRPIGLRFLDLVSHSGLHTHAASVLEPLRARAGCSGLELGLRAAVPLLAGPLTERPGRGQSRAGRRAGTMLSADGPQIVQLDLGQGGLQGAPFKRTWSFSVQSRQLTDESEANLVDSDCLAVFKHGFSLSLTVGDPGSVFWEPST